VRKKKEQRRKFRKDKANMVALMGLFINYCRNSKKNR